MNDSKDDGCRSRYRVCSSRSNQTEHDFVMLCTQEFNGDSVLIYMCMNGCGIKARRPVRFMGHHDRGELRLYKDES